jgi:hypothetical protein
MGLMFLSQTEPATAGSSWPWRLAAALLIVSAAALRFAFLVHNCPLDLAPDEAHYWDWSRNLDWSYYSKGPLVARSSTPASALLGEWSERLVASQMLAVRLPAVPCGSLLLDRSTSSPCRSIAANGLAPGRGRDAAAAADLGRLVHDDHRRALHRLLGLGLVAGHHAVFRGQWWPGRWPGCSSGWASSPVHDGPVAAALGFLLMLRNIAVCLHPGPWVTGRRALCCLPIPGLERAERVGHVPPRATSPGALPWTWSGPLVYVGVQAALLLGFWFIAWWRNGRSSTRTRNGWPQTIPVVDVRHGVRSLPGVQRQDRGRRAEPAGDGTSGPVLAAAGWRSRCVRPRAGAAEPSASD